MSLTGEVTVKIDMKELTKFKRRLIQVAAPYVEVGFFDGKPHPADPDMSVAQIAAINEFGVESLNIPERPFMATTVRSTKVAGPMAKKLRSFFQRTDTAQGLWTFVGLFVSREMSNVISAFSTPPNAPLTIALKGFDDPLVETGYMRDNVEHRIVR